MKYLLVFQQTKIHSKLKCENMMLIIIYFHPYSSLKNSPPKINRFYCQQNLQQFFILF
mgnify:CR=1 FL=1|jgi:hypothetical protein